MDETEYIQQRRENYQRWYDKTSFHPFSDIDKVLSDPQTLLPKDGNFHVIANNLEEIKEFMWKIESQDRWVSVRILKDPFRDLELDENWEDDRPITPIRVIENIKTLRFNEFFEPHERLQVFQTKENQELFELEFREEFLEELTFPCLVQYSGVGGWDRGGDFEINHCQVINLKGCSLREGPMKITVESL